jgi:hypothetical protein
MDSSGDVSCLLTEYWLHIPQLWPPPAHRHHLLQHNVYHVHGQDCRPLSSGGWTLVCCSQRNQGRHYHRLVFLVFLFMVVGARGVGNWRDGFGVSTGCFSGGCWETRDWTCGYYETRLYSFTFCPKTITITSLSLCLTWSQQWQWRQVNYNMQHRKWDVGSSYSTSTTYFLTLIGCVQFYFGCCYCNGDDSGGLEMQ